MANTLLEEGATGIAPAHDHGELPLVRGYDTDDEEASRVVTWISAQHRPGTPWRSLAVLARTNAQLEVIATHFETANVPFQRRGADHSPASDVTATFEPSGRRLDDDAHDAVALSTIHRAKGLEFQHVAVVGWAEGQLPHYNATTPSELAEEQRLAYVALSRAERSLLLTWSKGRNDPRYPDRQPSRFLEPILQVVHDLTQREAPLTGDARRARLAAIRASLEESGHETDARAT